MASSRIGPPRTRFGGGGREARNFRIRALVRRSVSLANGLAHFFATDTNFALDCTVDKRQREARKGRQKERMMSKSTEKALSRQGGYGALYAMLAYGFWGLAPIYWKWVRAVPPLAMVAHRVLWSLPVLLLLVLRARRGSALCSAVRSWRQIRLLMVTAALICSNWLLFIWAVTTNRVLDASLGYYINPLINVVFGLLFLQERLRPWQAVAVGLATAGVLNLTLSIGVFPWVSLALATSFGIYGLLRKVAATDGLVGLAIEMLLLSPMALAHLTRAELTGTGMLLRQPSILLPIACSGLITALPLLWFANAARRLRYGTLGFFQYIAPTGHFLLAIGLYGEPFTFAHTVTFGCIWLALAVYTADSLASMRRSRRLALLGQ